MPSWSIAETDSRMKQFTTTSLVLGISLMVASFLWPNLVRQRLESQNKDDLSRANEATGVLHSQIATQQEKATAREVHQVARGHVDFRIRLHEYAVWICRGLGIILTIVGIGTYWRMSARE